MKNTSVSTPLTKDQIDIINNPRERNQVLHKALEVIANEQPVSPDTIAYNALMTDREMSCGC